MKNRIKYVIFSVLLITGLSSCIDDFLELETPPGQMDAEELLSDPGLINSVLNGTLKNMGESDSYRNVVDRWFDAANTDIEMWKTLTTAGNAEASIMQYNVGVNNTQYKLDKVWSSVQENIDICNNVISWFADSTNTLLQGDKKNAMRPLYAKALTLRAYYYYDLIRWWGDVQLRFDANLYAPKTDRNTIYKFIIDDLKKAEDYIGWAEEMQSNSYYEINAD
ncbi:MAG: RagB/SusD family nutrient uptake outer membrane protein, partial [Prevotellaceae bacterium]|nr:RagB/SusD family nutrient uptake outer membrane protein [Prevotellaceae bacterium]